MKTLTTVILEDLKEYLSENGFHSEVVSGYLNVSPYNTQIPTYNYRIFNGSIRHTLREIISLSDPQYREKFLKHLHEIPYI